MSGLSQANVFSGIPEWQTIVYRSAQTSKLLKFEVAEQEATKPLYFSTVISREEKMTWQSFQDLLSHAVSLAQASMRGLFGLDVLTVDLQNGIQRFNAQDLSRLLINHSKDLDQEPKVLIRYGQLFMVLHKRAPVDDWGKIELKTYVEIMDPEKIRLACHLKKMIREGGKEPGASYLIHDISQQPIWGPEEMKAGQCPDAYFFHASMKMTSHLPIDS